MRHVTWKRSRCRDSAAATRGPPPGASQATHSVGPSPCTPIVGPRCGRVAAATATEGHPCPQQGRSHPCSRGCGPPLRRVPHGGLRPGPVRPPLRRAPFAPGGAHPRACGPGRAAAPPPRGSGALRPPRCGLRPPRRPGCGSPPPRGGSAAALKGESTFSPLDPLCPSPMLLAASLTNRLSLTASGSM